jgi:nicotinate-nucleotide adenylyltransferase
MFKMNKNIKNSVLLFGGSFDPPHLGHKAMLLHVLKTLSISKVIILPCNIQPLKNKEFSLASDRFSMCKIQFADPDSLSRNLELTVSDYEIKKKGLSYTVDTVKYFKELYPEARIYVLMGEDSFLDIEKWKSPKELLSLCSVVVLPRNKSLNKKDDVFVKFVEKIKKEYGADIIIMDGFNHPASSTELRQNLYEDLNSKYLEEYLDKDVFNYIRSHNLYKKK